MRAPAAILLSLLSVACGSAAYEFAPGEGKVAVRVNGLGPKFGHFLVTLAKPAPMSWLGDPEDVLGAALGRNDLHFEPRFPGFGLAPEAPMMRAYKLEIPDVTTERQNLALFKELQKVKNDDGTLLFAAVDTDKSVEHHALTSSTMIEPTDPGYVDGRQYYLDMIRWREAMSLWEPERQANAAPVVVALLDTGVQANHEDLASALWQDPDGEPTAVEDEAGHGTMVAGVIAAQGGNGKGILGAASLVGDGATVQLMSLVALDRTLGGSSDGTGRAAAWAIRKHEAQKALPGRERQKLILNLSLGGVFDASTYPYERSGSGDAVFRDEVLAYAKERDVLVIVAAGNDSCEIGGRCGVSGRVYEEARYYPCSYEGVLCVAATTHTDSIAGFSNRGRGIGLAAPGWGLLTTAARANTDDAYAYFNGTSAATPLVSGVAAAIWSAFPELSAEDVKLVLRKSAARIPELTAALGADTGRLDFFAAMSFAHDLARAGAKPGVMEPLEVERAPRIAMHPPDVGADPAARAATWFDADTVRPSGGNKSGDKGMRCGVTGPDTPGTTAWHSGLLLLVMILMPVSIYFYKILLQSKARYYKYQPRPSRTPF